MKEKIQKTEYKVKVYERKFQAKDVLLGAAQSASIIHNLTTGEVRVYLSMKEGPIRLTYSTVNESGEASRKKY